MPLMFRVYYQRLGGTFVTGPIGYVAATLIVASIRASRRPLLEQGRERLRILVDTQTARRWQTDAEDILIAIESVADPGLGALVLAVYDVTDREQLDHVATAIEAARERQAEKGPCFRPLGGLRRFVAAVESILAKLIGVAK